MDTHLCDSLVDASGRGHNSCIVRLLSQGASVKATHCYGWTALHHAVEHGHVDCVQTLIVHGADVNLRTTIGNTPLHLASFLGRKECVLVLLSHGADRDAINDGQTPLDMAENDEIRECIMNYEEIPVVKGAFEDGE